MRRWRVWPIVGLLLSVAVAGCLDPFRPHVDAGLLADSPHAWTVTQLEQEDNGWFGPNLVQTEYRFEPEDGPPFPALLLVLGVRGLVQGDPSDLLERTRDVVESALEEQGVVVDPDQELTGERTLLNDAHTRWFRLVGESEGGGLFASSEEVRALGETWFDGRSNTNVIVVAMAQTTGDNGPFQQPVGQSVRDNSVWDEIVGDPAGSIGGALSDSGFIHGMVSHE